MKISRIKQIALNHVRAAKVAGGIALFILFIVYTSFIYNYAQDNKQCIGDIKFMGFEYIPYDFNYTIYCYTPKTMHLMQGDTGIVYSQIQADVYLEGNNATDVLSIAKNQTQSNDCRIETVRQIIKERSKLIL